MTDNHIASELAKISDLLDKAAHALRDLRSTMIGRTESFRRLLWAVLAVTVLSGVTMLGVLSVLGTVRSVVEPDGAYQRDARTRTAQTLQSLVVEIDCRHRRALEGMPAPLPDQACAPQTPAEVYPG